MSFGPLFFMHTPKSGGTAVQRWLTRQYADGDLCPRIENDPLEHTRHAGDYGAFKGYRLYAGHYGFDIFERVERGHAIIANFRHPIARVISTYNYFRNVVSVDALSLETPRYRAVRAAKKYSFDDFVRLGDPIVQLYISDHQARQFHHSGWSARLPGTMEYLFDMIDRMPWFYVCEFPDAAMQWAKRHTGLDHRSMPRENVTGSANLEVSWEFLETSTIEAINSKNCRDLALYEHAVARLLYETGSRGGERPKFALGRGDAASGAAP